MLINCHVYLIVVYGSQCRRGGWTHMLEEKTEVPESQGDWPKATWQGRAELRFEFEFLFLIL